MIRFPSILLVVFGLILGLGAWWIRMVSEAHGHGLASGDRRAIVGLISAAVACLAAAVVVQLRSKG